MIMNEIILAIGLSVIIIIFLTPYYALTYLKDIANELSNIRRALEGDR